MNAEIRQLPDGRYDGLPFSVHLSMNRPMPEGLVCHYCEAPATTRDHIVAKTKMGVDQWWNLVPSCKPCNEAKGSRHSLCSCEFCWRARDLFDSGYRRNRPRKTPKVPSALGPLRPGPGDSLPPSFPGAS